MPAQPSAAQSQASRLHGLPSGGLSADPGAARSSSPISPEGKARSAQNATRHDLCSGSFVLIAGENPAEYARFEAGWLLTLHPADLPEREAALGAVHAMWRTRRADRLEAQILADLFAAGEIEDEAAAAAAKAAGMKALATLLRYRARLERKAERRAA